MCPVWGEKTRGDVGDDGGEGVCAAGVWVREAEGWLVGVVKSGGTGQGWRQGEAGKRRRGGKEQADESREEREKTRCLIGGERLK